MGLFSRAMTLIKTKINDLLERSEDPRQTLEYSYEQQRDLLQKVRRGLVEERVHVAGTLRVMGVVLGKASVRGGDGWLVHGVFLQKGFRTMTWPTTDPAPR